MNIKLLTEHHLEFLSLKGGRKGSSESTHVKMPHCWKSNVAAHISRKNGDQVIFKKPFSARVTLKQTYLNDIVHSKSLLRHMLHSNKPVNGYVHSKKPTWAHVTPKQTRLGTCYTHTKLLQDIE